MGAWPAALRDESLLIELGARPHLEACESGAYWAQLENEAEQGAGISSDCAVCMSPVLASDTIHLAVELRCGHRFHRDAMKSVRQDATLRREQLQQRAFSEPAFTQSR